MLYQRTFFACHSVLCLHGLSQRTLFTHFVTHYVVCMFCHNVLCVHVLSQRTLFACFVPTYVIVMPLQLSVVCLFIFCFLFVLFSLRDGARRFGANQTTGRVGNGVCVCVCGGGHDDVTGP